MLSLSVESFVEAERGDLARARECAELAMDIVEARGLRAMPQASLAFAALGQAQAAAGKVDDALVTLEVGLAIRRQTTAQGVWGPIHHLLVTARVAAQAGRVQMARELLAELVHPDEPLPRRHGRDEREGRRGAAASSATRRGRRCSTSRSPAGSWTCCGCSKGDLSLHEIAGELYLSSNTVKTHARAVYRKLGAHSRAEAVRIARRQSLI